MKPEKTKYLHLFDVRSRILLGVGLGADCPAPVTLGRHGQGREFVLPLLAGRGGRHRRELLLLRLRRRFLQGTQRDSSHHDASTAKGVASHTSARTQTQKTRHDLPHLQGIRRDNGQWFTPSSGESTPFSRQPLGNGGKDTRREQTQLAGLLTFSSSLHPAPKDTPAAQTGRPQITTPWSGCCRHLGTFPRTDSCPPRTHTCGTQVPRFVFSPGGALGTNLRSTRLLRGAISFPARRGTPSSSCPDGRDRSPGDGHKVSGERLPLSRQFDTQPRLFTVTRRERWEEKVNG